MIESRGGIPGEFSPDDPTVVVEGQDTSHVHCPAEDDGACGTIEGVGFNGKNVSFVTEGIAGAPVSKDPCARCVLAGVLENVEKGKWPVGTTESLVCRKFGLRPHEVLIAVEDGQPLLPSPQE